jgi:hypothetical protein
MSDLLVIPKTEIGDLEYTLKWGPWLEGGLLAVNTATFEKVSGDDDLDIYDI